MAEPVTPRDRFIAACNAKKGKVRRTRLTLKSIVVENLDAIVQFREEDGIDLAEIAADLAEAYGITINERSFRTTVSLLRNKGTPAKRLSESRPKAAIESVATLPIAVLDTPKLTPFAISQSSSVEAIRDDDPDL